MNDKYLIVASGLKKRLNQPDLRILDCRFDLQQPAAGRKDWLDSHIPGAAYADLNKDLAGPITADSGRHPLPDTRALCQRFGNMGIATGDSVVVYDSGSGAFAARAWWLLRWLGHRNVALLDGGFAAWQKHGFPVESGERRIPRRIFEGAPNPDLVLRTEEVVSGNPVARRNLIDARDAARYRGEIEPIDALAGHIPGTRNLPFAASLREDGHWKEATELRSAWDSLDGGPPGGEWAVMCGSGVTACHLALSAVLAGLRMPRLYVGSWSEWIREPGRGVEVGYG